MDLPKLGNNSYRKWTEVELTKLRELAAKKSISQLAKYFNTTNTVITTVACRNRIQLNDDKIHWTEEDKKLLKELAKTLDLSELAIKMNRTTSVIRLQAKRQNIKIIPSKKSIESVLECLTRREREIILKRFYEEMTQKQVGEDLNLSQPTVDRIEAKALRKLKHPRNTRKVKDFLND